MRRVASRQRVRSHRAAELGAHEQPEVRADARASVPRLDAAAGPFRTCTGFPDRSPVVGRRLASASVVRSRVVSLWLPVLVWAVLIFALSSISHLSSGLGTWDYVLRKCAHLTEYAILGALLLRALGHEAPAFFAGVAYAASDELHQHFVAGRHSSPVDLAIDAGGVALGLLAWFRVRA